MENGHAKAPPDRPDRRSVLLGLLLVLSLATALRVFNYLDLRHGPLLHLQVWTQSDMHFFDNWAKDIVAGDLLTSEGARPYHRRHVELACRAFAASGGAASGGTASSCTQEQVRRIWDGWVGERSLWQDPLYAYLLAALYASFGATPPVVYAAHAMLGLACVALVYFIALRLYDLRAAVAAGLAAALFGPLLFYESVMLRAVPIAALGLAACYALMVASDRARLRPRILFLAGVLAGLLCLLKSSWLVTVGVWGALLGLALVGTGLTRAGSKVLVYLGGVTAGISPLVLRNAALGLPLFRSAATGPINFINGNAADRVVGGGSAISDFAAPILMATGGAPVATVRATIATHDGVADWLMLLGAKLVMFFNGREIPNNVNYDYFLEYATVVSAVSIGFALVAGLAVVGLWPWQGRRYAWGLAVSFIVTGIAVCTLFFNLSRFRLPIACMMFPLAGGGYSLLVRLAVARRWGALVAAVSLSLVVAAVIGTGGRDSPARIRIADYGVANEIALQLARRATQRGEHERAVSIVLDQLDGEPEALRAIRPGPEATTISVHLSGVAGTFIGLHEFLADAQASSNAAVDDASRDYHRRRAVVLRTVNRPYAESGLE